MPRFACGSMVLAVLLVCGFKALRALKPHTFEKEPTAVPELVEGLPKAQCANCLSPMCFVLPAKLAKTKHKEIFAGPATYNLI